MLGTCRFLPSALLLAVTALPSGGLAQQPTKATIVQMHAVIGVGEEVCLYAVPKQLGYFQAEGLDVGIQGAQSGTVSAQVIQSGGAELGTTAAESVLQMRRTGRRSRRVLSDQAEPRHVPGGAAGFADQTARRLEIENHRGALLRSRRRPRPESKFARHRHHARPIHRAVHRCWAGRFRSPGEQAGGCAGDLEHRFFKSWPGTPALRCGR